MAKLVHNIDTST